MMCGRSHFRLCGIAGTFLVFLAAGAGGAAGAVQSQPSFSEEKAEFAIRMRGLVNRYRVLGVYLLPGEVLDLEVAGAGKPNEYMVRSNSGEITRLAPDKWAWRSPEEIGLHTVKITGVSPADSIILNAFVMVPYNDLEGEYLRRYRMGKYPRIPLKKLPIYKPPRGFVEVTPDNEDALVSPHFKLKQFLCKQESGYPKYVVLKESLILKLELILSRVNKKGFRCDTFHIMSGYRTPYYNKAIGNVRYSRHLWGGAADIFIDVDPEDGMMDDLNRDGKIDYRDAAVLYDIIDAMYGRPFYERFVGGLARYKKTAEHGPFVHVDVRGFRARWGD